MPVPHPQNPLYRIDKFVVPESALAEFLALVERTHEVLRGQSGFVRDLVLEQVSGPGRFNVVTLVEWSDGASLDGAVDAVRRFHDAAGFDGRSVAARLGVSADIAIYGQSAATPA
jgi:hypothetical protein